MSKRYGNLEVQEKAGEMWLSVASIDGGKDDADKWIAANGMDGKTYRVVRAYSAVDVKVRITETRLLTEVSG